MEETWFVYLLKCSDSTIYCGISNNVEKRVIAHNKSKGAKYTKTRTPVELIWKSTSMSKSNALKLEYKIKQMPREEKLKLCQT